MQEYSQFRYFSGLKTSIKKEWRSPTKIHCAKTMLTHKAITNWNKKRENLTHQLLHCVCWNLFFSVIPVWEGFKFGSQIIHAVYYKHCCLHNFIRRCFHWLGCFTINFFDFKMCYIIRIQRFASFELFHISWGWRKRPVPMFLSCCRRFWFLRDYFLQYKKLFQKVFQRENFSWKMLII